VSNSEVGFEEGGAGALRFDDRGRVIDAYRVLDGTSRNCSGGTTPWGTWLSCEENGSSSQVYECDPLGVQPSRVLPSLGSFNHEAVEIVESVSAVFLSEDSRSGRLYRFTPTTWPDLTKGLLEAASVAADGAVTWIPVLPYKPDRSANTTAFNGGEGLAAWGDALFLATKGDKRIWHYDIAREQISIYHDCVAAPDTILDQVDNLMVDHGTGDLFVAEDGPTQDLALVLADEHGALEISGFIRFVGHGRSEVTGPAISPDRSTLLVSSQRGTDGNGITYAISGPFRQVDPGPVPGPGPGPGPDPDPGPGAGPDPDPGPGPYPDSDPDPTVTTSPPSREGGINETSSLTGLRPAQRLGVQADS